MLTGFHFFHNQRPRLFHALPGRPKRNVIGPRTRTPDDAPRRSPGTPKANTVSRLTKAPADHELLQLTRMTVAPLDAQRQRDGPSSLGVAHLISGRSLRPIRNGGTIAKARLAARLMKKRGRRWLVRTVPSHRFCGAPLLRCSLIAVLPFAVVCLRGTWSGSA